MNKIAYLIPVLIDDYQYARNIFTKPDTYFSLYPCNPEIKYPENVIPNYKPGLGYSLWMGLTVLYLKGYEFIVVLDGDGQHDYPDLSGIDLKGDTLYIFSRKGTEQRLISKLGNMLIYYRYHVKDATHGLKIYPSNLIPYFELNYFNNSFSWQVYVVKTALKNGFKVVEIPTDNFHERKYNASHMKLKDVILSLLQVVIP